MSSSWAVRTKGMKDKFPDAQYWGSCTEYPNCTPDLGQSPRRQELRTMYDSWKS